MGVHGVAQLLELLRRHTACLWVLGTDHHGRRRVRVCLGKHQVRDDSDLVLLLVFLRTQDDLACLRLGRSSATPCSLLQHPEIGAQDAGERFQLGTAQLCELSVAGHEQQETPARPNEPWPAGAAALGSPNQSVRRTPAACRMSHVVGPCIRSRAPPRGQCARESLLATTGRKDEGRVPPSEAGAWAGPVAGAADRVQILDTFVDPNHGLDHLIPISVLRRAKGFVMYV